MKNIAQRLTDLVGGTPLLELGKFSAGKGLSTPVIAKIEYFNPGGSVKDRIALAMIEDAEARGNLIGCCRLRCCPDCPTPRECRQKDCNSLARHRRTLSLHRALCL